MTISTHITTSGGLISAAFIENIRELGTRQRGIEPESFALPWQDAPKSPAALEETIATAWELLKERWDAVRADLPMMDLSQVRARWLLPLFQLLDFDPVYLRGDTVLDETGDLRFPLSHCGWQGEGAPILHTVAPSQGLDTRSGSGRGVKTKSPHDMLQAFLNASRTDHWALLTNGIVLRLLRDYHHTFTKGYVEFDLESIFETRNYGDFRALYRMAHASRFIPQAEKEEAISPLEQFYKDSLATGIKVGEDLRGQVRQAIETLGNGFLAGGVIRSPTGHPDAGASGLDGDLMRQLQADPDLCRRYYAEILHIVYRILFLLFAEQRGMLPHAGAPLEDLYRGQYSITALRTRAEGDIAREEGFTDLWEGLQVTFRMLREGAPQLGVFGYDGMLFADGQTPLLDGPPSPALPPERGKGASRACRNSDLLRAIRALTLIEREGVLQRISYADLGVEELGSIYESLLDFTPSVSTAPEDANGRPIPANTFFLDPRGAERKTTGSYYTHPSLVNELIKSALLPVARDRLAGAGLPVVDEAAVGEATAGLLTDYAGLSGAQRAAGEAALLSLKICDPAAGSGHFLVKANNTLGAELARIRSGDDYPAEERVQSAKRDVLAHCIYAVDLNPMAVELCKVSLWINASVRDKPLSFLDHHIKCGNSLIGATPELMEDGIPTDAFQAVTGDHKPTVNAIRRRNRAEREQEEAGAIQRGLWQVTLIETPEDLARWRRLTLLAEEQPQAAREAYGRYTADPDYQRKKLEADFWTAAFFWPLPEGTNWTPTHGEFRRLQAEGPGALAPHLADQIEELAERYHFFHWHLEFPDVFADDGAEGFDVVLGNPPWESLEFKTEEYFANRVPEVASAPNAAVRKKMIADLERTNPQMYGEYQNALRDLETTKSFVKYSERFALTGSGTINLYAIFAENDRNLVGARGGRLGIVVQTSIATEWTYRSFFKEVLENKELVSLYDFQNRRSDGSLWFQGVDSRLQFCLFTLSKFPIPEARVSFFTDTVDNIYSADKVFRLLGEDVLRINPNTLTVPVFRYPKDANLTRKIYRLTPAIVVDNEDRNDWQVILKQGIFNISGASGYFRERKELASLDLQLNGNRFISSDGNEWLPVYEDWMIFQFDHRYNSHESDYTNEAGHQDPSFIPLPRYWIERNRTLEEATGFPQQEWFVVFRDRARTTDARTAIFAVVPLSGVTHPLPMIGSRLFSTPLVCAALANFNSFAFDYIARQKLSGYHLAFYVLKQQSTVPPSRYTPNLLAFIVPRVLELTYTAWDIKAFADDVWREADETLQAAIMQAWEANVAATGGHVEAQPPAWVNLPSSNLPSPFPHPPFKWDEERRAHLRAELDALYAHLYGLTREELDYILDTFPIVRRKDEERYGDFRTKRLVLEYYERLEPLRH